MSDERVTDSEPPLFLTLAAPDGTWGVGLLVTPSLPNEPWYVHVRRTRLTLADACDLRDAWEARGTEKRP